MVKSLSDVDQHALHTAIRAAEDRTSARIGVVVVAASDGYREFLLLAGFLVASAVCLCLWASGQLRMFPWLLMVQIAIIVLTAAVPPFRRCAMRLAPKEERHARAAHGARNAFHALQARLPSHEMPLVLLYVSLQERYVHVLTNPVVHKERPGGWEEVTERFKNSVKRDGLRPACLDATAKIAEILSRHFPRHAHHG